MADVVPSQGTYFAIDVAGGTPVLKTEVEEWTHNPGGDVHESRGGAAKGVNKDGGITNDTITFTSVDTDLTFWQVLMGWRLTKVDYEVRFKNVVVATTNPKMTGSAVLQMGPVTFGKGDIVRFTATLHCDGEPVVATS